MGVQLFRAGTGAVRNGIKVEQKTFDEYSYLHLLKQGWFYTPEECYATDQLPDEGAEASGEEGAEAEQEPKAADKGTADGTEKEAESVLTEDVVRAQAKAAGIGHYWDKSIDKLKEELANAEDSEE